MSFSGRLSRTLRRGVPLSLAILLLPSVVFVIALFRERESNSTKGKIAGSIALGPEQAAGPVHLAQPGLIESHAFHPPADELRTRLERLTNVLIALTVVLVVLSGILLTHG